MRRMLQTLAVCAMMAALPAVAQPVHPVLAGLEDGLRNLDGAIASLGPSRPSPAKDRALSQLAITRTRLVEAMNALGGRPGPGGGRHHGHGQADGATVTVGTPMGGTSVSIVVHDGGATQAPPPVAEPLPAGPQPMDGGRFRDLLSELKELGFSKDQQNFLRDAARHHYFLSEQVRQVVALFDFGTDKVESAATLYPRTLDHENFYQVQKEMEFESDRDALRKRIREIDSTGLPAGF